MEIDQVYFIRRAGEERVAAMKCSNPHARRSHLEMAKRYDERANAIESHPLTAAATLSR